MSLIEIYGLGMLVSAIVHTFAAIFILTSGREDPLRVGMTWALCVMLWPLSVVFLADAIIRGVARGAKVRAERNRDQR